MSRFCLAIVVLSSVFVLAVEAQTPRPQASRAPSPAPRATPSVAPLPRPQFRPAVLATGPDSAINRIDVKALLKQGQKDGAVQFGVAVGKDGRAGEIWTYHAMPGSTELEKEVLRGLSQSRFTPPIYNYQPVVTLLSGTVIFDADVPPHLRIFLNQDPKEIRAGNDFVAPQPVIGGDSGFDGLNAPPELPVAVDGIVELELQVDGKGNLEGINITGEDPPLLGFREAALDDFQDAKFIPAFRSGDPIESKCVMTVCYKPIGIAAPKSDGPAKDLQLQLAPPNQEPN